MATSKRPVVVLTGPTASGKSGLAMQLAHKIAMQIVSVDARQVFKHLDVGTAKPTAEDMASVPHHCIDICHPNDDYNASMYASDAGKAVSAIPPDALPVFVGGSGLYITAAIDGFSVPPTEPSPEIRETLANDMAEFGIDVLYGRLYKYDRLAAEKYSDRNPRRVMRALEFIATTNTKFSDTWKAERVAPAYDVVNILLHYDDVQILNNKINDRCEKMWSGGLLDETEQVLKMGVDRYAQSLRTVGYKEALNHIVDFERSDKCLADMKTSTRQYAKRQRTWFRRDDRYRIFEATDSKLVDKVISYLKKHRATSSFVDL